MSNPQATINVESMVHDKINERFSAYLILGLDTLSRPCKQ